MAIYSGSDCRVFFKAEGSNTYGDYDITGITWTEIPLLKSLSVNWDSQRPKVIGFGTRKRLEVDTAVTATATYPVTKEDYSLSIEGYFEASEAQSVCRLVSAGGILYYADIVNNPLTATKSPQQFSLLIEIDEDRDGSFELGTDATETQNSFIVCKGCYVNSATISSAEGEYISYSIEFSVRDVDNTTYTNSDGITEANTTLDLIADPQLIAHYGSNLAKAANFTVDADIAEVSAWSVTINNNFTKSWGLTDALPYAATAGALEVTGSFTKDFVDMVEFAEIDTANPLGAITIVITCPTGGAQTIALTDVNYDTLGMDFGETELIKQEINFTAGAVNLT